MRFITAVALALIAVGCADAGQSAFCESLSQELSSSDLESLSQESSWEDMHTCAEQGNAYAQSNLGFIYRTGIGVPNDDVEAARWFQSASEQGMPRALSYLGYMYMLGHGVPEDNAEGFRLWRSAAEQGYARAQFDLGMRYAQGYGVPEDVVLAYMWSNLAAAQGNLGGQTLKDRVEQQMTPEQIAEAQRLSREWLEAHPPSGN